jgi:16S rRNA processing protein RimM
MSDALWSCGVLGKVHGLHGELYLNLGTDGLERLRRGSSFFLVLRGAPAEPRPCTVTRVGGTDQRPLVLLDLAGTRDEALAIQGGELFAAGDELQEQPHYRVGDLLGLPVRTASGHLLGEVTDVLESPAHEILEILGPDGGTQLVPLVDELVTLDAQEGVLRVVDGLLDEPHEAED